MTTQIYIRPEVSDLIHDTGNIEEWNALIDSSGLSGQNHKNRIAKAPVPFLAMNSALSAAVEALCPREIAAENYSFDTIPLEAVKMIALAKSEGYFQKILIRWDDTSPDPVAIGITGHFKVYKEGFYLERTFQTQAEADAEKAGGWTSFIESGKYLLARWGDEAKALSQIIRDGKSRFISSQASELKGKILDLQHELNRLEITADARFGIGGAG